MHSDNERVCQYRIIDMANQTEPTLANGGENREHIKSHTQTMFESKRSNDEEEPRRESREDWEELTYWYSRQWGNRRCLLFCSPDNCCFCEHRRSGSDDLDEDTFSEWQVQRLAADSGHKDTIDILGLRIR